MVTILTGGTILSMDDDRKIYPNGAIAWEKDRILWVGLASMIPDYLSKANVISATGKVILPGFVNTHTHATLSILRGIADDLGVAPAYNANLPQVSSLPPQDCYIFSLLGGLEALKFGTTCIVDNYINENMAARAFAELGMRAVVSERLHDANLKEIPDGIYEFSTKVGEDLLERNFSLIQDFNGAYQGRITCRLGPHAPDTCSQEYLEKLVDIAQKIDTGFEFTSRKAEKK